ncbi:MAG: hypothetical protein HYY76_05205 [Acidobacteria bacterium]|nr:hypothetical protein [Acidobacteriota bacterium]
MAKDLKRTGLLAVVLALGAASPVLSHHSHAMFDHTNEVTVTGTVTEFVFRNPHVFLYLDVKNPNGEVINYSVEMSNIPNMIRRGITPATFKPGDTVTVKVHPLKDGRRGGNYVTVTAADGKTYE